MSAAPEDPEKLRQWRLEAWGHSFLERLVGCLPSRLAFHLGELLGAAAWPFMRGRRQTILRNLRIALGTTHDLPTLEKLARASFIRTAANMVSAARTARMRPEKLHQAIEIENLHLLTDAIAARRGTVILLAHMGNWELLARLIHFLPRNSAAGAFYRPLNNPVLDRRILKRRQADGTRMFSKRDSPLQVASFLRQGGAVGILSDQRVAHQGELSHFFGRLTRSTPLPSLLARRARATMLALSLETISPGKWRAAFHPVAEPATTDRAMDALEKAMARSPVDVFWLQERWRVYADVHHSLRKWLGDGTSMEGKRHRALLWLPGFAENWTLPADWLHPDLDYEAAADPGAPLPPWLPPDTRIHPVQPSAPDRLAAIDRSHPLPLDFILTATPDRDLRRAARRLAIPVITLP